MNKCLNNRFNKKVDFSWNKLLQNFDSVLFADLVVSIYYNMF